MKVPGIPPAVWLLCVASVIYNVAVSSLPTWLYVWAYTPANVVATAVLLRVAKQWFWVDWSQFGITRSAIVPGITWGVCGVLIAGLLAFGVSAVAPRLLSLPPAGPRAETLFEVFFQVFVRIALGTVLLEEFLFRGVLLQLFNRYAPAVEAAVLSSIVFGVWHVGFAIRSINTSPDGIETMAGPLAAFFGATVLFGVMLAWMTARSGTLVAPMTTHWLLNAVGTILLFLKHS